VGVRWERAFSQFIRIVEYISKCKSPPTIYRISKDTKVDQATVRYYIKGLLEKGYVRIEKQDGRNVIVPNFNKIMPYNGVVLMKRTDGTFFIIGCPYFGKCGCDGETCRLIEEIGDKISDWLEKEEESD